VANVVIGVIQEGRAEAATRAISSMVTTTTIALRNEHKVDLEAADLVPGDVVFLAAGDKVPADLRILESNDLRVVEAALTGESTSVHKTVEPVPEDAVLGDRHCMAFMGTLVIAGDAKALVVETGDRAQLGQINTMVSEVKVMRTPLQHQMDRFGLGLSIGCIGVVILTFLVAYLARDEKLKEALKLAVSVAVALIPEGLPTVVTVTLALGVQAMARNKAIVRKLPAVETLGAVTCICSDKTGTLTRNEMSAVAVHFAAGRHSGEEEQRNGATPDHTGIPAQAEEPMPMRQQPPLSPTVAVQQAVAEAAAAACRPPPSMQSLAVSGVGYNPYGDIHSASGALLSHREMEALRYLLLPAALCNDAALMPVISAYAHKMLRDQPLFFSFLKEKEKAHPSGRGKSQGSASFAGRTEFARLGSSTHSDPQAASTGSTSIAHGNEVNHDNDGSDSFEWCSTGDPTEAALLALVMKSGMNYRTLRELQDTLPRLGSIPFSSENKFMATIHDVPPLGGGHKKRMLFVKGAVDVLLPRCATQAAGLNGESEPLDEGPWRADNEHLASGGMRVLAICQRELPRNDDDLIAVKATTDLVLGGPPCLQLNALIAIVDPPREEAIRAVRDCTRAGITVKMITGDHASTARTIADQIGIGSEQVLTGPQLQNMTDAELAQHVNQCHVYARASPEHKLRIVRALQKHRHVVAMTGDGVNDAPALRQASVGVAMGIAGTEVAKEASRMILQDDNFATIAEAVRLGRGTYDNLRKLIAFILPTTIAQGFSVAISVFAGIDTPLTQVQILFVNMITAATLGLVLAAEEPEPDVMRRPPRRVDKQLVGKLIVWRCLFVGGAMIGAMLGQQAWTRGRGGSVDRGHTMAMNTLVLMQCAYVLNCRFFSRSSATWRALVGNRWLLAMVTLNIALQVIITYTPGIQGAFSTQGIDGIEWLRILLFAVVLFILVELEKAYGHTIAAPCIIPAARRLMYWLACGCFRHKHEVEDALPTAGSSADEPITQAPAGQGRGVGTGGEDKHGQSAEPQSERADGRSSNGAIKRLSEPDSAEQALQPLHYHRSVTGRPSATMESIV
jgi:magnesium-transporting ATPase (P-type)